ncbi:MAG: spore maturation protein [Bacteroidetes bacterium]|nr:spore maturation protein [Bacteroidota bacterium]
MRDRRYRRADRHRLDRHHGALAGSDESRRESRSDYAARPPGTAAHHTDFPRYSCRSPCGRLDDHEYLGKHARTGQRGDAVRYQGDGGTRQTESEEGRGDKFHGNLSGAEYVLCDADSRDGDCGACCRGIVGPRNYHRDILSRIPDRDYFRRHYFKAACQTQDVPLGTFGGRVMEVFRTIVSVLSAVAIPALMLFFLAYGAFRKVKVYEEAVEGAKEGFNIAVRIIPYLVLMLVSIAVFRASGAMDVFIAVVRPLTDLVGIPAEALPMAIMRPLSGSGSLGIMTETMQAYGTDSVIGVLVSTLYGSTETTFYVLAVYFGAVGIRNTRHALPTGLLADFIAFLAAVFFVGVIL